MMLRILNALSALWICCFATPTLAQFDFQVNLFTKTNKTEAQPGEGVLVEIWAEFTPPSGTTFIYKGEEAKVVGYATGTVGVANQGVLGSWGGFIPGYNINIRDFPKTNQNKAFGILAAQFKPVIEANPILLITLDWKCVSPAPAVVTFMPEWTGPVAGLAIEYTQTKQLDLLPVATGISGAAQVQIIPAPGGFAVIAVGVPWVFQRRRNEEGQPATATASVSNRSAA
jgi:hypothetical protein